MITIFANMKNTVHASAEEKQLPYYAAAVSDLVNGYPTSL